MKTFVVNFSRDKNARYRMNAEKLDLITKLLVRLMEES